MTISVREYRHLSRMDDFRFWNENLKKREPWYASIVRSMPSFKTATYDTYFKRLQFFWTHLRFLLAFSAEQAFLRWRFTQDRAKMAALDVLAKRVVPIPSRQVCIGYGDWSRRDGIKGYATGPVKGFVKALKKRATVVPVDEYRTSVTCSSCHKRLKQARLEGRAEVHSERLALYQQSMQGELLEPRRQCREEYSGTAPKWAEGKA
ncbi:DNA phosphorothioation-dependent restriction protein DptG [Phytophthora palmivora]|uniref:DNA phosphorothioation-dependent restriction protein DptG n=1 Tax=Phytophthora palmivora TaxID=4796 RepID=A0A2P4YAA2_9STRA|nr:DNA phosphorothioation-dependent restriction protein DptG [Phytophthora palmivora]